LKKFQIQFAVSTSAAVSFGS